jgi:hypothetical protein
MGRPATPTFRKSWILAAAAGIIIIVLAGNLLKTNWNQVTGSRFGLDKVIGKKPAIHKKEPQSRPGTHLFAGDFGCQSGWKKPGKAFEISK